MHCKPHKQVHGESRRVGQGEGERESFSFSSSNVLVVAFCHIAKLLFTRIACEGNPRFNTSISLMMEKSLDELFGVHILPVLCILSAEKEAS